MANRNSAFRTLCSTTFGFVLGVLVGVLPASEALALYEVRGGVLDLRETSLWSGETVRLSGKWCFVPDAFVGPEILPSVLEGCDSTINVPSAWGTGDQDSGPVQSLETGRGYGSYVMLVRLKTDEPSGRLAIRWERAFSAASAYIYGPTGELLVDPVFQGRPGENLNASIPVLTNHVVPFSTRGIDSFLIVMHVSNFRYFQGGLWFTPSLSSAETAQQTHLSRLLIDMVVFGILVVVALYHIILYVQRREDRTPAYFAMFCTGIALRLGVMAHFVESLGFARSVAGFEFLMSLEYSTAPLAIIGAGLFLSSMMPSLWFQQLVKVWFIGAGAVLVLFTVFASVLQFSVFTWVFEIHVAGAALGGVMHLAQQVRAKNRVARWVMVAFVVLVVGVVNDIAHIEGFVTTAHVAPYCFVVFVLIQSAILAQNFAETVEEKTSLSRRVLEQTARLAEETKLRADAEHELRLELEAKVMLLGDAVHHLNNPLNHIHGVGASLADDHQELMTQFEALLPPREERDESAQAVVDDFEKRFSVLDSSTDILLSAVGRAADTVMSLRVLSGVDGVSFEPSSFEEVWSNLVRRSPSIENNYRVTFANPAIPPRCLGASVAYVVAIELLINRIEELGFALSALTFEEAPESPIDEPSFWYLTFDLDAPTSPDDWTRTCTAVRYLLRPYWCECEVQDSAVRLELLREMPKMEF